MIKKFCSFLAAAIIMLPAPICSAEGLAGISAKSYILVEKNTGEIIFEKDPYVKLPMASTTKIMTTLLCLESGDLDTPFVVDSEAIKTEGSSMGLVEGDIVTKRALCIGMLLPSGNDAANAVAVHLGGTFEGFAKMMNQRAAKIGMTRTCFVTPSGLEAEGHGSSAYDMALLAGEAMKNEDFAGICSKQTMKLSFGNPPYDRWLKNTNKLLGSCDGVNGVKTGFTDEAGRCLVSSCERNGISLICVTLNDPNDYADHKALYDKGFSMMEKYTVSASGCTVNVVGGEKDTLRLAADTSVSFGVRKSDIPETEQELNIKHFLYAPVEKDTYAGTVNYYCRGRYVGSSLLYTAEGTDIKKTEKKQNLFQKIRDFFIEL